MAKPTQFDADILLLVSVRVIYAGGSITLPFSACSYYRQADIDAGIMLSVCVCEYKLRIECQLVQESENNRVAFRLRSPDAPPDHIAAEEPSEMAYIVCKWTRTPAPLYRAVVHNKIDMPHIYTQSFHTECHCCCCRGRRGKFEMPCRTNACK